MKISIIGVGMGSLGTLTGDARAAIERADVVIGAERLLLSLPDGCRAARYAEIQSEDIIHIVENNLNKNSICVLMSGDVGFYSGAKQLLAQLDGHDITVIPGVSSVQYLAAHLRRPWQDWKLVSAHGKDICAAAVVSGNAETFFLTGGTLTVQGICAQLVDAGLGSITATVGENLGSPDELIKTGTAEVFSQQAAGKLAVLLVDNPAPGTLVSYGLPDEVFLRGEVPMTKSEVRSVVLSKLRLRDTDILYDVGAGTGSVSVEAALLLKRGHVYAFERESDGCELIKANAEKFCTANLTCVAGVAPEAFAGCPAPDAAFVGGSGGRLAEVMETLLRLNPRMRIVVSAVTLETITEASMAFEQLPIRHKEIVQLSVSRARLLGAHHLMTAQNPIYLFSGEGGGLIKQPD